MRINYKNVYISTECKAADHARLEALGWKWHGATMSWRTADPTKVVPLADHCEGEAAKKIQATHAEISEALELSAAVDCEDDFPAPPGYTYRGYQKAGIKYAMQRQDTLIGDGMRLGKTIQALGVLNAMHSEKPVKHALIIPPAGLKINWQREATRWLIPDLEIGIAHGKKNPETPILIMNYDIVHNHKEYLHATPWDLAVFDEAHRLKNRTARRTKVILGDGKKSSPAIEAARRLFLTGTALYTRPIDLWVLCQECDPTGLGANWWRFVHRYCAAKSDFMGHLDTKGASNLEELQRKMRERFMVRRTKEMLGDDMPPKRQIIPLSREGAERLLKEQDAIISRNVTRLQSLLGLPINEAAQKIVAGEAHTEAQEDVDILSETGHLATVRRAIGLKKIPQVIAFTDEILEQEEKVVLFAYHRDVVKALHEHYSGSVCVMGGMSAADKQAAVDKFQTDPNCRLFVGNYLAAGEGITLAEANVVIEAELAWIPSELDQAEERVWLLGKEEQITIYRLVYEKSLDERMCFILDKREDNFDRAMNIERILPSEG